MPSKRSLVKYWREKHFEKWIGGYLRHVAANARAPRVKGPRHLLFAVCDHYEPLWGEEEVPAEVGDRRVRTWEERYPTMAEPFRDADGHPPRHSFFFPGEEYQPSYLERLARLAQAGFGEVELHLHHDNDTAEGLVSKIEAYLKLFAEHGHISRGAGGRFRYAFIHGNWCLANARADGRMCGVDNELPLLFDTGCYADLTFPAAPDECQPNIVNQIYWPTGDISQRRAYEHGRRARVGEVMEDRLLMIQGPLSLGLRAWGRPVRIEGSHLTAVDPPTPKRIDAWVSQNIHVEGRPEWVFVKVHTHGIPEATTVSLLGDGGRALHRCLTTKYNDGRSWVLHYVTAREMYNIAKAAMAGETGDPGRLRDFEIRPPEVAKIY